MRERYTHIYIDRWQTDTENLFRGADRGREIDTDKEKRQIDTQVHTHPERRINTIKQRGRDRVERCRSHG